MKIYRNGKGKWSYSFSCNGSRFRKVVGLSKQECESVACGLRDKVRREGFGLRTMKNIFFEAAAQEHLEQYSKANKRSWKSDKSSLKKLAGSFKGKFLAGITAADIEKHRAERRKEVSGPSVNREMACLSTMMRRAQKDGKIDHNPVAGVSKYPESPPRARFLDNTEMVRFVELASPRVRSFFKFALITGMRLSEIRLMRWSELDFKARTIRIPAEHAKSKRPRTIPMDDACHEILMSQERKAETVFFNESTLRPIASVQRAFAAVCRRGDFNKPGQERLTFHSLRHSAISGWIRHGVDLITARNLAGHGDIRITAGYCHSTPELERRAVTLIGAIFLRKPETKRQETAGAAVDVPISRSYLSTYEGRLN